MAANYKVHPAADLYPYIEGDEWIEFCQDIEKNGLLKPIVVLGKEIVDGRNRYKACIEVGVEPKFTPLPKRWHDDVDSYVRSVNDQRRHATVSQRALVAAKRLERYQKQDGGKAAAEIAEEYQVGTRSVESAKSVIKDGSTALVKKVQAGEIPIKTAEKIVKLFPDKIAQTNLCKKPLAVINSAIKKELARSLRSKGPVDPEKYSRILRKKLIKTIEAAVRVTDEYSKENRNRPAKEKLVKHLQDSLEMIW